MSFAAWESDAATASRVSMALQAARVGTYLWNPTTGEIHRDEALEDILGLRDSSEARNIESYLARVHPEDRTSLMEAMEAAFTERRPTLATEHRIIRPGGEVRWVEGKSRLSFDDSGNPTELIGILLDVTERREAEDLRRAAVDAEERARQRTGAVQRRLEMLAKAANLLDAPLELDAALQQVADLAIEVLADWCSVDLVGDGRIKHAAVAHRDPAMVALAHEVRLRYPPDPHDPQLLHLIETLEPLFVEAFDDRLLDDLVPDEEHRALVRRFAISSYLVVPLVAGGRGIGVITLVSSHGRRLDPADVDLALDLGRRAGAAVEKTRLYAELKATSQVLQKSLLPPRLPAIPGVGLSAYYRSGTEGLQIGGDFYDAFRTERARWWVALGDVVGKGPAAAALTAAVRHALRAAAPDSDDPGEVLRRVNSLLIEEFQGEEFASVLLATFLAPAAGDASAEPLRLAIASGGHPPPFLRTREGSVTTLGTLGTLMGLVEGVTTRTVDVELGVGDTLLLYTDGATEARLADGNLLGDRGLKDLFAAAEGADRAGGIASRLLEMAGSDLRDDLAMMTITAT